MIRFFVMFGMVLCAATAAADIVPKPEVLRARMAKAVVSAGYRCPAAVSAQFAPAPEYQSLRRDGYKVYVVDCAQTGRFVVAIPRWSSVDGGRKPVIVRRSD
ncbi:MAG: hypothetical protein KDJ16_02960 [Hyphomicrobiales bacterium]|nr:hypothetical protein [Hyphomicrobiales bacterium]